MTAFTRPHSTRAMPGTRGGAIAAAKEEQAMTLLIIVCAIGAGLIIAQAM